MAKRPTLTDLTSLTNSSAINTLSQNWDAIEEAFDNTLSLDGSTPNAMNADLDLNGNGLLNVGSIDVDNLTLNGQTVIDLASVPEWRGAWATATSYAKNDLVKTNGNVYICLVAHTSGTFATDLTALKWELMVSKGDSGAGTGDLVSTNNLSDVANPATSRSNLGLGTVATENTVPVAMGGTGATDAASAIIALGAQPLGSTLTSLESLSLVAGDVLYATAADTLTRLPKGTAGQVLKMNSGATAPEWAAASENLTSVVSLSGASPITVTTTIPANCNYVELWFNGVSLSSTGHAFVQLGDSGFVTTGYDSSGASNGAGVTSTTGFIVRIGVAAQAFTGTMIMRRTPGTNIWIANYNGFVDGVASYLTGAGKITLAAPLERIRITASAANDFDGSGTVYAVYR